MECDITYPKELHDLHNDYPLAPERMIIDDKFKMSTYRWTIIKKFEKEHNVKINKSKVPKLASTLTNKSGYVVHAKLFMYYAHLGLEINVTKILSFKAKHWIRDFINFNIEKRKGANNDFEVDFLKLMNNSVYGKTMENIRKRCNITVVDNEDKALKHIAKQQS